MGKFNFQNVDVVSIQGKGCAIVVNKGESFFLPSFYPKN